MLRLINNSTTRITNPTRSKMIPKFITIVPVGPVCVDSGRNGLEPLLRSMPPTMAGRPCLWSMMPPTAVSNIAARNTMERTLNIFVLRGSRFMIEFSQVPRVQVETCRLTICGLLFHHRTKTLQPQPSGRLSFPPPLGGEE